MFCQWQNMHRNGMKCTPRIIEKMNFVILYQQIYIVRSRLDHFGIEP